jgi:hypothetical protein
MVNDRDFKMAMDQINKAFAAISKEVTALREEMEAAKKNKKT